MTTVVEDCQFVCITQADYYKILHEGEDALVREEDEQGELVKVSEVRRTDDGQKHAKVTFFFIVWRNNNEHWFPSGFVARVTIQVGWTAGGGHEQCRSKLHRRLSSLPQVLFCSRNETTVKTINQYSAFVLGSSWTVAWRLCGSCLHGLRAPTWGIGSPGFSCYGWGSSTILNTFWCKWCAWGMLLYDGDYSIDLWRNFAGEQSFHGLWAWLWYDGAVGWLWVQARVCKNAGWLRKTLLLIKALYVLKVKLTWIFRP